MKLKDIPLENRPRERMKKNGLSSLSDAEVLALIVQKGTRTDNVIENEDEYNSLKSQILDVTSLRFQFGTSKSARGGRRHLPYVFTEQGVSKINICYPGLFSFHVCSYHIEYYYSLE